MRRCLVVFALLVVVACKKDAPYAGTRSVSLPVVAKDQTASSRVDLAQTPAPTPAPELRMIIRTANVSLVVRDAVDVLGKATALVESMGGYVSDQRQWKDREQVRASLTLRVPAAQLNAVLAALRQLSIRVESENISGQDVSQEFSDLGAQLKNLQATETELRELLHTVRQRTQKASEILEVFTEMSRVRGDIERIQGRIQYLSQVTAMSAITVELIPDVIAAPVVEPGWQPVATLRAAARALVNTLKVLADVAIWIVLYVLPIAVVFMLFVLAIRSIARRVRGYNRV